MVQTERGPTYLIERESLLTNLSTNTLSSASQELVSQQAMEFVQELLRPFVSELGEIREELGAERVRREMAESTLRAGMAEEQRRREEAERERDDLRRELYALREARESPQTVEDQPERAEEPRSDTEGAQGGTERPQQRHGWREPLDKLPWWQYVLGLFLVFSAGLLASIVAENLALRFDTPIFVGVLILGAIVWSTPGIFGFWVGYRKRNLRLRSQVLPLGVLVSGVALLGAHGEQLLLTFAALNYINLRDLLLYFFPPCLLFVSASLVGNTWQRRRAGRASGTIPASPVSRSARAGAVPRDDWTPRKQAILGWSGTIISALITLIGTIITVSSGQ